MSDYTFPTSNIRQPKDLGHGSKRAAVLVACGTFSPITCQHLRMFENARDFLMKERGIDVVAGYVSPVHEDYGKRKKGIAEAEHRLEMCKLALKNSDWIAVDDWEIKQPEYSRTRQVLAHFVESVGKTLNRSDVDIFLLCGADLLESFIKPGVWRPEDVEFILSHHGVVVIERVGVSVSQMVFESDVLQRSAKNIFQVPEWVLNDVSSTKVRMLIKRKYSIKYLIHDEVIDYINKHDLYSSEHYQKLLDKFEQVNKQ
ncbi:nicotinamide mononucleotide adenylyltransferase [Acrasis kona]|uniref:Nicotinamide-nucleotide adenylyltransferase n=1 Tax=Acrasis kona TaxID=1008807 RepID=A0AAW2Z6R3_9EUKA